MPKNNSKQKAYRKKAYRKGLWAETAAALILRLKGYRIIARRYKCKSGEVDLIAVRGQSVVFVEVKARSDKGAALDSVTAKTRMRIEKAALWFVAQNKQYADYDMRFDVIAVSSPFSWQHLDNAWQPRS